jgi:hypothetical protein
VQKFDRKGVYHKKLNDIEVKEEAQVKISNGFRAFESLMMMMMSTSIEFRKLLEGIRKFQPEILVYYELKQHIS